MSEKIRDRYNRYVKDSGADDLWGQVRRTVDGKPLGDDQVALILDAISSGLDLLPDDVLLDLCCGNGMLTDRLFAQCKGGLGVDFSDALIEVARMRFERPPHRRYALQDVVEFVEEAPCETRFTKALCQGSFAHLSDAQARRLLTGLRTGFPSITRFFVGNLPDKSHLHDFYYPEVYRPGIEDDNESPLGLWRTEDEFVTMATDCGWNVEIRHMPAAYAAAYYRFDAVLTPA